MESKFRPLHNWILVEVIKEESDSLIELVESYKKIYRAKVISAGEGYMLPSFEPGSSNSKLKNPSVERKVIKLTVKEGDVVEFPQHVVHYIKVDGKNLMLVKEHELHGIVE